MEIIQPIIIFQGQFYDPDVETDIIKCGLVDVKSYKDGLLNSITVHKIARTKLTSTELGELFLMKEIDSQQFIEEIDNMFAECKFTTLHMN